MFTKLLNLIDGFLNKITMYKLVLYVLIGLLVVALLLSSFGHLAFGPLALLFSTALITTICLAVNILFAWAFKAPTNVESVYITALILALIISPISHPADMSFIYFALWASIWAIASKYILAIKKKHVFNPAAFAVVLTAITMGESASWWVGTLYLAPFVLIGGLLITRKIRRFDLVGSFFVIATVVTLLGHMGGSVMSFLHTFWTMISVSPVLFFALIMLTEPLTTPPRRWSRMVYGAFVGLLFLPLMHIGSVYITPEIALVLGNILSYVLSPKKKLILALKEKISLGGDIYDFVFTPDEKLNFTAGQYLEWTLDKEGVDSRGNRRYFTIASSPTESSIRMGVKFYPKPSTFKTHLLAMHPGDILVASQLAGDFTMPKDITKKLVFIAGGIGVTPFRSMVKCMLDTGEKRDVVLMYSNRKQSDIVYKELFDDAAMKLGTNVVYAVTDVGTTGFTGFIDKNMILHQVPDFKDRYFYISGPHNMVTMFEKTLSELGVKNSQIHTDYFPGFV